MKEPVRNFPASIQARLKSEAELQGRPFVEILQYYAMERFLYRLSRTRYATKFVLKGGLLFYAWNIPLRRPTRDIDFRGYVTNDSEILHQIFREVTEISMPEDGIAFDSGSISIEETQIDADYQGVRTKLTAYLGRSKVRIQVDIGFSDALSSKAEPVQYPNILSGLKQIQLKSYPKVTVVAEKLHAMIRHAELNSRMKDYYDLWLLAGTFEFDSRSLQEAIETTFKQRATELPSERPVSLSIEFAVSNNDRWTNCLKKMNLEMMENDAFSSVVEQIWKFLEHPLRSSLHGEKSNRHWRPTNRLGIIRFTIVILRGCSSARRSTAPGQLMRRAAKTWTAGLHAICETCGLLSSVSKTLDKPGDCNSLNFHCELRSAKVSRSAL